MTAEEIRFKNHHTCDKCGSEMRDRKMSIKHNGVVKWRKIRQCITCRHWYLLER